MVSTISDQRSINVSWMILECQDHHGNITMYEVRYGDTVNQTLNTSSGDETSLEVDDLEEFVNYTIEVRAYTAIGPGPYSSPIDAQTLPDRKCVCVCACVRACVRACVCECACMYDSVTAYHNVFFACLLNRSQ